MLPSYFVTAFEVLDLFDVGKFCEIDNHHLSVQAHPVKVVPSDLAVSMVLVLDVGDSHPIFHRNFDKSDVAVLAKQVENIFGGDGTVQILNLDNCHVRVCRLNLRGSLGLGYLRPIDYSWCPVVILMHLVCWVVVWESEIISN